MINLLHLSAIIIEKSEEVLLFKSFPTSIFCFNYLKKNTKIKNNIFSDVCHNILIFLFLLFIFNRFCSSSSLILQVKINTRRGLLIVEVAGHEFLTFCKINLL